MTHCWHHSCCREGDHTAPPSKLPPWYVPLRPSLCGFFVVNYAITALSCHTWPPPMPPSLPSSRCTSHDTTYFIGLACCCLSQVSISTWINAGVMWGWGIIRLSYTLETIFLLTFSEYANLLYTCWYMHKCMSDIYIFFWVHMEAVTHMVSCVGFQTKLHLYFLFTLAVYWVLLV